MSQLQVTGEAKIRDIQGPVVANSGVITALDGAASQYVRGDGTLADFPTSTGGGSSVSYYLNGSVNQGTFAGSTYYEMSKTPIIGAGTDFPVSTNGLVAQFITDANDPDLLEVPGGNFNLEFYFSVSNNTGNPTVYAELYKYDGTTFTLLGSSVAVPESLNQGTTIAPYYFAIPVGTAALALTDRIAIRIYANVDGRTVTLHTENSHLCQVVTTFSKGMVSLNNLTDQSQYLTTGTSGTDFNIVSSGDTHTFNIPSASASNRGLITTGNQTIAGNKIFTSSVNVDNLNVVNSTLLNHQTGLSPTLVGTTAIGGSANGLFFNVNDNGRIQEFSFDTSGDRVYTFPALTGTIALLEGSQTFSGSKTFNNAINAESGVLLKNGFTAYSNSYTSLGGNIGNLIISGSISSTPFDNELAFTPSTSNIYEFPNLSGTLAMLEGSQTFSGSKTFSLAPRNDGGILLKDGVTTGSNGYVSVGSNGAGLTIGVYNSGTTYFHELLMPYSASYNYTFPAATGTLALTSDLADYVTLATTQTISGSKTFSASPKLDLGLFLKESTSTGRLSGYVGISTTATGSMQQLQFLYPVSGSSVFRLPTTGSYYYEFPDASGTLALTSNLSAYLPLTGGTLTGNLTINPSTTEYTLIVSTPSTNNTIKLLGSTASNTSTIGYWSSDGGTGYGALNFTPTNTRFEIVNGGSFSIYTSGNERLTVSSGGTTTLTGSLNGTSATFSGNLNVGTNIAQLLPITTTNFQILTGCFYDGSNIIATATSGTRIISNAGSFTFNNFTGATIGSSVSDTARLTIASTGAATFSSSVSTGGIQEAQLLISRNFSKVWNLTSDGNGFFLNNLTDGTYPLRVLNGGNVGIGTNSPNAQLDVATTARFHSSSNWMQFQQNVLTSQNTDGAHIRSVVSADSAPTYSWAGDTDTGMYTPAANTIAFSTGATERMRITSGGNVLIGKSTTGVDTNGFRFDINGILFTSVPTGESTYYLRDTTNAVYRFYVTSGGTINATNTTISAISDVRLKENIVDLQIGLDAIMALRPRQFDWKKESGNDGKNVRGFIAQEFEEVFPDLIDESINKTPEGEPYKQIRQDLIPILVKAIQELNERIKQLENK